LLAVEQPAGLDDIDDLRYDGTQQAHDYPQELSLAEAHVQAALHPESPQLDQGQSGPAGYGPLHVPEVAPVPRLWPPGYRAAQVLYQPTTALAPFLASGPVGDPASSEPAHSGM